MESALERDEESLQAPTSGLPLFDYNEGMLRILKYMENKVIPKLIYLFKLNIDDYDQVYDYFFWNRVKQDVEKFDKDKVREFLIEAQQGYYNPKTTFGVPFLISSLERYENDIYLIHKKDLISLENIWKRMTQNDIELHDIKATLKEIKQILKSIEDTKKLHDSNGNLGAEDGKTLDVEASVEDVEDSEIFSPEDEDLKINDEYLRKMLFTIDEILKSFLPNECRSDEGFQNYLQNRYKQLFDKQLHPFIEYLLQKGEITTEIAERLPQQLNQMSLENNEGNLDAADQNTRVQVEERQKTDREVEKRHIGSGFLSFMIERLMKDNKDSKKLEDWKYFTQIRYELIEVYGTWTKIPEEICSKFITKLEKIKKTDNQERENSFYLKKLDETLMIKEKEDISEIPYELFEWMKTFADDRKKIGNFINYWDSLVLKKIPIVVIQISEDFGMFKVFCSACDDSKWKDDAKRIRRKLLKYDKQYIRLPTVKEIWKPFLDEFHSEHFDDMYEKVVDDVLKHQLSNSVPILRHIFQQLTKGKRTVELSASQHWVNLKKILLISDKVLNTFLPEKCKTDGEILQYFKSNYQNLRHDLHPFFEYVMLNAGKERGNDTGTKQLTLQSGVVATFIEEMEKKDFNLNDWKTLKAIRYEIYTMVNTRGESGDAHKGVYTKLEDICERRRPSRWRELIREVENMIADKRSNNFVLDKINGTIVVGKDRSFTEICSQFYDWVKSIENLFEFDETYLWQKKFLGDIPLSALLKSRNFAEFKGLCSIWNLSNLNHKLMETPSFQVKKMKNILLNTMKNFDHKLHSRIIARNEFLPLLYAQLYQRFVQKACTVSDKSSKLYYLWKRISHKAGSWKFGINAGEEIPGEKSLKQERCLAELFSNVWNPTKDVKRLIFIAHGSIKKDECEIPPYAESIKEVRLFPPWGCLLGGSTVEGILDQTLQTSDMRIVLQRRDKKETEDPEKVYWSGNITEFHDSVPAFNVVRPKQKVYNVELKALNLDGKGSDVQFLKKLAFFLKKKAKGSTIIPFFSLLDSKAPIINLQNLINAVKKTVQGTEISLDVLCCLGPNNNETFPSAKVNSKFLATNNYCSVRLRTDIEKRSGSKISMVKSYSVPSTSSTNSNRKANQPSRKQQAFNQTAKRLTNKAVNDLLQGISPDAKTAKEFLELIYFICEKM